MHGLDGVSCRDVTQQVEFGLYIQTEMAAEKNTAEQIPVTYGECLSDIFVVNSAQKFHAVRFLRVDIILDGRFRGHRSEQFRAHLIQTLPTVARRTSVQHQRRQLQRTTAVEQRTVVTEKKTQIEK